MDHNKRWVVSGWAIIGAVLIGLVIAFALFGPSVGDIQIPVQAADIPLNIHAFLPLIFGQNVNLGQYVVLGWNDLGMHCYNRDFQDLAVLPPFNNLMVQVVKRGAPPQIITSNIVVSYSFPENTYSYISPTNPALKKSNFWDYAPQLFNVTLPPNIGLTGKGLSGQMDLDGNHFSAVGIPLTEYNDNDLTNRQPFQLATIVVKDLNGNPLASNQVVAPVSTEMTCNNCHEDNGIGNEGIALGKVERNILKKHDNDNMGEYPAGHTGALLDRTPVLCAECHASNALGAAGVHDVPSLSNAMHNKHTGIVPDTLDGCYNCHPGPSTRCLRDVMSTKHNMTCINCHGGMAKVGNNPSPWKNEPQCTECHTNPIYKTDNPLYRLSKGHGGIYCEACHDSTHAIAPSTQTRDAIKFINLQGKAGPISDCKVCHTDNPTGVSPHQP